jgi:hypothetical protein
MPPALHNYMKTITYTTTNMPELVMIKTGQVVKVKVVKQLNFGKVIIK